MTRSITRGKNLLFVPEGGVEIPEVRDSDYSVTLVLRVGTTATTGMHWHEKKTEYIQVLEGCARVTVGDTTINMCAEDGIITIHPFIMHEYGRADEHADATSYRNIDLRIREWTSPPDRAKEVFFRNVLGVIHDRPTHARPMDNIKTLLALSVIMEKHDNYPVVWKGPKFLGEWMQGFMQRRTTYLFQGALALAGRACGFKSIYTEYTPRVLLH